MTETPVKGPGAECDRRQRFIAQGTKRAARLVIPGHSAKTFGYNLARSPDVEKAAWKVRCYQAH